MATTEKKFLDKEGLAKLVQLIKKGIVEADDFLPFDKVGMGIIKQTSTSQYDGIAFVKDQFAAYVQDGLNVTYYNNWDNRERYNTALNGAPIEGKFYVNTTNGTINIWTGDKLSVLYSVELNKINDVLDSIPDEIITNLTSNGDTDTFTLRQEKKVRDGDETFDSSIAEEITIPSATEALAGLMSAEDKKKLNKAATLDDTGKIPANNLPSYVDDVVEYETKSAFPGTGEQGKIYVALDSNLTYRWSGTGYVEISPSLALGETANTAYAGDKGVELEKKLSALTGEVGTKADDTKTTEKIDAINDNIAKINRKAVETLELSSTDKLVALKTTTIEDAESEVYLRGATIGQAGVMTADDKNKLENTIYEEQQRQIAEKQRSTSEESRSTAESGRVTAENARVAAENSRVAAEQTREQSFTVKVGEVDTAIKNCNTATQGAERVDATITEANVLQVTDRNGAQKTLDLAAVAKANGVAEDVNRIKESMGAYSDRPNITLTAKENNVAISADGVKVSKSGWAIAEFTAELGNIYLFNPGETSADVCVFAEYIDKQETRAIDYAYTYDESGRVLTAKATYNGKTYTYTYDYSSSITAITDQDGNSVSSLPSVYTTTVGAYQPMTILNANAELPEDGYCRFVSNFTTASAIKIVVSYKVGAADLTMKVVRDGSTANMCSQLAKINKKVDEVSEKVPKMWVNLTPRKTMTINVDGVNYTIEKNKNYIFKEFTSLITSWNIGDDSAGLLRFNIKYNELYQLKRLCLMGCASLPTLDVSGWDTSKVTDMGQMFQYCYKIPVFDVSGWDTSKVTNMRQIFHRCSSLTSVDVSGWDTSKVTDMQFLFASCSSLTTLDVSGWDTSKVTDMGQMFQYCTSLTTLTFGENFGKMTDQCRTLDLSSLSAWKNDSVKSLLTLYDRKANGMGVITIKLHANAKNVLGEDGIAQLTAKGYTIA